MSTVWPWKKVLLLMSCDLGCLKSPTDLVASKGPLCSNVKSIPSLNGEVGLWALLAI